MFRKLILVATFSLAVPIRLFSFSDCGEVTLEGEWIYFRPSVNSFVLIEASGDLSTNVVPTFSFSSGWRASLGWQFWERCQGLILRWTQLHSSVTTTLNEAVETSGTATQTGGTDFKKFRYHAFEGLFYQTLVNSDRFNLYLLAGAHYVWLVKTENFIPITPPGLVKQNARTWGVGPELGVDLNWSVCGCLSLTGRATGSLLVSRQHASVDATLATFTANGATFPTWKIIPAANARFGLRYTKNWFYIEGGYELVNYNQAMLGANFEAFAQDQTNADMHGPYISAGISF